MAETGKRRKIPYGISNFRDLVEQDYYYIDKTRFIELLEAFPEKYLFFLRPRRFGKSLFVSVLQHYYDRAKADRFNRLFSDLYIGKNQTPLRNSYYVLSFDFSGVGIQSEKDTLEGFKDKINFGIRDFLSRYGLDFDYSADASPENIMSSFLSGFGAVVAGMVADGKVPAGAVTDGTATGSAGAAGTSPAGTADAKLYVLIDEYDHFTSELLGYRSESFESLVARSGYYRKFFEVLKIGTKTLIDRMFVTGVNPFTLDSLTSGFNIGSDLTLHPRLHDAMGFTEAEVVGLFGDLGTGTAEIAQLRPLLKKNYDGYRFSLKAADHLYNSDMILYFAKDYLDTRSLPDNLIDENLASSYARIKRYIDLGDRDENLRFIRELLEGDEVFMALTTKFQLVEHFRVDDFKSLLFYMGLLTLAERDLTLYRVKIPNYVIRELYFDFFEAILREDAGFEIDAATLRGAVAALAKVGDIGPLVKLTETMLGRLANKDFRKFDEKYVKLIMLTWLFLSRIYYVKSEYEVEGGLIDIALLPRANVKALKHAIIELKYLAKQETSEEALAGKIAEAREQLARYSTSEELRSVPNLLKFAVVFRGEDCVYAREESDDSLSFWRPKTDFAIR